MMFRILLLVVVLLPITTSAQFGGLLDSINTPEINLVLDTSTPEPGQEISVKLDDYAGGFYGSTISWYYNGVLLEENQNQRNITITAGELGGTYTISAVLESQSGQAITVSQVIKPTYIDIILEPQTHVPVWYQGRAKPSLGSQINATVLIDNGSLVNNSGLVYKWTVDNKVLEGGPLRGQNKMSFSIPWAKEAIMSVVVTKPSGELVAEKAKMIYMSDPDLDFYERHSLYGDSVKPVGNSLNLIGNSTTIVAEPFNLDSRVFNSPDVSEWKIDGFATNNGSSNPYEITLTGSESGGFSRINFHVRSLQTLLQGTEADFDINF